MEHGLPSMKSIKSLKSFVKRRNNTQDVVKVGLVSRTCSSYYAVLDY